MADYQDSDLLGDSGKVDTAPLDEDDDFFDVLKEVTPITEKWRAIGHALRLKHRELDSIAASHPHNAEECLSEMLSQWLRRNYNVKRFGEPSWQRLVEAVGDPAGGANPAVANQIAEKHRAKQTTELHPRDVQEEGGGSGGITVPGKLDSGATVTTHSTLSTAEPITGGSPSDSASPSTTYQENTATDASTHPIIQGKGSGEPSAAPYIGLSVNTAPSSLQPEDIADESSGNIIDASAAVTPPANTPEITLERETHGHPPSLRELDQLPGMATIWYRLGLQLGIRADDLEIIEKNYPRDADTCKIKMFAEWQRGDTNPTYEKLVRALAAVGKRKLAESVCSAQGISPSVLDTADANKMHHQTHEKMESDAFTAAKTTIGYLQNEYEQLVMMTQEAVEAKSPTLKEFRTSITLQLPEPTRSELETSLMKKLQFIYDAKSIDTIFGILNLSIWSYLNFGLLQHLVEVYGDDKLQQRMLNYTTSVESFRKATTLKVFWKASPATRKCPKIPTELRESLTQISFKHGNLDPTTTTLNDIERYRQDLAQEYSFPDFTIILAHIEKGCIVTIWLVPPSLATKLADELKRGNVSFLEQHNILELKMQESTVYRSESVQTTDGATSGHSQTEGSVLEISFSDLEIGDELGEGAFGVVYRGHWKSRDMDVAIKRVPGKINKTEIEILSKLRHPCIIQFHGVVVDRPGLPEYCIITELAEGGSLYDLIHKKNYQPSQEESLRWAVQIAQGMKYLHHEKMMHRDLKSSNVLLTGEGNIKICDFGGAKHFEHTTKQTQTGTYRWMAPEMMKGEPVSQSSDIFSYGMLLYEILTGELPFADAKTDVVVSSKIMSGEVPAIPASVEFYLAITLKQCWSANPKARPSFHDILEFLTKNSNQGRHWDAAQPTDSAISGHSQTRGSVPEINLSDLEFGEQLGEGAFGVVYKGHWKSRDMDVAIKRVPGKIDKTEIEIINKLKHPCIIQFHGVVVDSLGPPEHYIITELAERGSLYDLLHKNNYQPSREESLQWAVQIALGMKYLHQEKMIHRYLKSSNVLLTGEGNIKICDFGGAKYFDHTTKQTQTGMYRWMAPEVMKGEPASLSSNVFSYGMLLYEILTGELPFADAKNDVMISSKIMSGEEPPIPASMDFYLAITLKQCWSANPKARPSFHDILEFWPNRDAAQTTDSASSDHSQTRGSVPEISLYDLEFGEQLGEGVFGVVYRGHWKSRGMDVAIKRVPGKINKTEIEIFNKLKHPCIIQVHGVVVDSLGPPEHYIITELAEGGSLYDLLHKKNYRPSREKSLQWAVQIAQGMEYLHQEKMIHQHLNSSNVSLTGEGNIKICDIGGAKYFNHTTKQTQTGTYRWMAPEVLKGELVSQSSDVFSYGMLLYEILTSKLPFADAKTDVMVSSKIMSGEKPPIPASMESYLAKTLKQCWFANPKARPSFQDILEMLTKRGHAAGQQQAIRDIQWRAGTDTPERMYRGAAVSNGKMAYFNCANSTSVYCYNSQHQLWRQLPNCHSLDSALVMTDDKVTTVGGRQATGGATNSLASLTGEEKDSKWVKVFPRMPTARYHLAAVCRGRNVIAAGGNDHGRRLSTVEILDIDLRQWSSAASLPHAMSLASFTVCEDSLYLLGGTDQNGWTLSVLTSSITDLLDQQQETANQLETASQPAVWHRAANTPYYDCTAVSVRGQLLAIGGRDEHLKHTSAVVAYDPTSDSWQDMGHIITPRYFALIALLPSNELIVAGGAKDVVTLSKVEIGTVV